MGRCKLGGEMKQGRYILCLAISIAIELFVFNFCNIIAIIENESEVIDVNNQMEMNEGYDGANVQWLIYVGENRKIRNVYIETDGTCYPDFYYTDSEGAVKKMPFINNFGRYIVCVNETVSGYIGISTYNDSLVTKACINSKTVAFSISHVVAMMMIYIAGSFLFSIQKMPDYMLDEYLK